MLSQSGARAMVNNDMWDTKPVVSDEEFERLKQEFLDTGLAKTAEDAYMLAASASGRYIGDVIYDSDRRDDSADDDGDWIVVN